MRIEILYIILSGIAGTATMTLFMKLLSYVTHTNLEVVQILGTMLTYRYVEAGDLSEYKREVKAVGTIAHYGVGVCFAVCYYLLWIYNIGRPDFIYALIFGGINGFIGIGIWWIFFRLHPQPPEIKLKSYFISLLLAHIVFALTVVFVYRFLQNY